MIDTQSVLDWLCFQNPACAAWEAWRLAGLWRWEGTAAMREELAHVLGRGGLGVAARHSPTEVLAAFDARCTLVPPALPSLALPLRCTDPDDQKFIDHAAASGARWLVSRDKAVLKLRRRALVQRGLLILAPAAWRPGEAGPT